MKYIVTYDTASHSISVLAEEAGHQTPIDGVTAVNFSRSGFSIWAHDRLAASEKAAYLPEEAFEIIEKNVLPGQHSVEFTDAQKPPVTTLKNQPEPIATIKLAADPKKTRRDIERYFAAMEGCED